MFETVQVPLWLLILILLFAAVTALDRVIGPSVRWYFRRRMEKVVSRINKNLTVPIQPFKLARRHDMIQRLIYDPMIAQAVAEHAREHEMPENVAFEEASKYAREIVPSFSASAYFGFAIRAARWLSTAMYRVRLGYFDEEAIASIDPEATIIFVMNHRSNMDYVLVTYLAAERSALSYAVGEWARVWPLSRLIRAMGAYFIRRRSRNTLYRRVLARYVQLATENGVTQAVFPEGGLSLDGKVGAPKLGLLSYILSGFEPGVSRDVVFVPIGLSYDRVLEDRVLLAAAAKEERRFGFSPLRAVRFVLRQAWRRLTGRLYRMGYASVSFGEPLSLGQFLAEPRDDPNAALGDALMGRIRRVVPVLPVPLVASVLADSPHIPREELVQEVRRKIDTLTEQGAHVHVPRGNIEYEVEVGLRMLTLRKVASEKDGMVQVKPGEEAFIAYYAASVQQQLPAQDAT
ncbi:MAG: 1-acyl-sn-glycerol-3-phosphate acyltransferase [Brevirhabdus sp.]